MMQKTNSFAPTGPAGIATHHVRYSDLRPSLESRPPSVARHHPAGRWRWTPWGAWD